MPPKHCLQVIIIVILIFCLIDATAGTASSLRSRKSHVSGSIEKSKLGKWCASNQAAVLQSMKASPVPYGLYGQVLYKLGWLETACNYDLKDSVKTLVDFLIAVYENHYSTLTSPDEIQAVHTAYLTRLAAHELRIIRPPQNAEFMLTKYPSIEAFHTAIIHYYNGIYERFFDEEVKDRAMKFIGLLSPKLRMSDIAGVECLWEVGEKLGQPPTEKKVTSSLVARTFRETIVDRILSLEDHPTAYSHFGSLLQDENEDNVAYRRVLDILFDMDRLETSYVYLLDQDPQFRIQSRDQLIVFLEKTLRDMLSSKHSERFLKLYFESELLNQESMKKISSAHRSATCPVMYKLYRKFVEANPRPAPAPAPSRPTITREDLKYTFVLLCIIVFFAFRFIFGS